MHTDIKSTLSDKYLWNHGSAINGMEKTTYKMSRILEKLLYDLDLLSVE